MIAVIDYGMGNLRSVHKALEVVGGKPKTVIDPRGLMKVDKIVLPGVGSFGAAMRELKRRNLIEPIKDAIKGGKYFLGLCLGLQLLFERSDEAPGVKGLGILKGEVKRFSSKSRGPWAVGSGLKVPHMGWNSIAQSPEPKAQSQSILRGVPSDSMMYFVHSYYVKPKDKKAILTTTDYGIKFVSGIHKDNIYGLQFHPEKSQELGLKILRNFVRL